jgi:hypothetical protein
MDFIPRYAGPLNDNVKITVAHQSVVCLARMTIPMTKSAYFENNPTRVRVVSLIR